MKIHMKNNRWPGRLRSSAFFRTGKDRGDRHLPLDADRSILTSGDHGMAERIGDYLVKTGAMQPSQVDSVLAAQKAGDSRTFGEIAVALGFATRAAVDAFVASHSA